MKQLLKYILIIALTVLVFSCSDPNESDPQDVPLEEKIGQMLLIGFRGMEINDDAPIAKDISAGRVGGVVLFDVDVALGYTERNIQSPEQVTLLNQQLSSYAKDYPLLICVDQEGGKVARLKEKYGFPKNVSQQYLGDLNNDDSSGYYGNLTANTLVQNGFNVNFAPVVDLNVNPESPAIGAIERSYSANPDVVTHIASLVIDEFHKKNVLSTLKHFPGHGSAAGDSHYGVTDVTNTWTEKELLPYQNLINAGKADMIMTAHIFNSNWDAEYPATLSKNVITGILRSQLGFDGVIVSDDMNMGAIEDHFGLEETIFRAIDAGVDILVFAKNLSYNESIASDAIEIIKNLIDEGKISVDRISQSYERIIDLKRKL
jgi:beta-N-acetylhexosaminidase